MGLVDVSKVGDTQSPWNLDIGGGVQTMIEWNVHVAPFSVQGWDGTFGAHPIRRWNGLLGLLCVKLQLNANYGPFEGIIH
jgi:hypothetical protein